MDKQGHLAAGTSTGGMQGKMPGRVGDSPIIGASTFAEDSVCGVSSTGHGEFFIRNAVAHDIYALMLYKKMSAQQATDAVFKKLTAKKGFGGVIVLDKNGQPVATFNTPGMYRAWRVGSGAPTIKIFKD